MAAPGALVQVAEVLTRAGLFLDRLLFEEAYYRVRDPLGE